MTESGQVVWFSENMGGFRCEVIEFTTMVLDGKSEFSMNMKIEEYAIFQKQYIRCVFYPQISIDKEKN